MSKGKEFAFMLRNFTLRQHKDFYHLSCPSCKEPIGRSGVYLLADVLETAQIGADYWACFRRTEPDQGDPLFPQDEIDKLDAIWVKDVLSGTGKVKIDDMENDEHHGYLSAEVIRVGLERFATQFPVAALSMFHEEQYDAESADIFLQICMFNDIVFS
jgi:hypothetical protein